VNFTDAEPLGTTTEDGTPRRLVLDANATDVPPLGAAAVSVTVQVLAPPECSDVGVQVNDARLAADTVPRLSVAVWDDPFSAAVSVTD
jgi:hypothetical protein